MPAVPPVFVEDHGELQQGALAQLGEQRVQVQGFGDLQHVSARAPASRVCVPPGHADCLLHVHDTHDVVVVALVERESGVAGGARQFDNFWQRGGVFEHGDLGREGHDFGGGQLWRKRRVRSTKRAASESRVPSSAERRTMEESSSGCVRRRVLLWLHAEASEDPVGGAVHDAHERGHDAVKASCAGATRRATS